MDNGKHYTKMKKLLTILIAILITGIAYSQSTTITVEKVKTLIVNGDTVYQISRTIKDTSFTDIRSINAKIDAKQAEIDIYQGYIQGCRTIIDALKQEKATLKSKAQ